MIRNNFFCSVMIFLFSIVSIFLPARSVFAGITGTEGGSIISSAYTISDGGSVTMYRNDCAAPPPTCTLVGQPPMSVTISGQKSGQYPLEADLGGAFVAEGLIILDRISISPASGYTVDNLIVDGSSKGAISTYNFEGNNASFTVSFKQAVTDPPVTTTVETLTPTTPDPKSSTKTTTTTPATTTAPAEAVEVPAETPAVTTEPAVATSVTTAEAAKTSKFPYWILFLMLLLLLLLILFLLWRKKRKEKNSS